MSLFLKIVTSVFGKKSDKDMKRVLPLVDVINEKYNEVKKWEPHNSYYNPESGLYNLFSNPLMDLFNVSN